MRERKWIKILQKVSTLYSHSDDFVAHFLIDDKSDLFK